MKSRDPILAFWARVRKSDGCWMWQGHTGRTGYGYVRIRGVTWRTHRLAYALMVGPIPDGLGVLHRCDTPGCCNPDHLFLGTPADNAADRDRKGRHWYHAGDAHHARRRPETLARGENHRRSKLTDAAVISIRSDPRPHTVVAAEYGVSATTVAGVRAGKIWRHVGGAITGSGERPHPNNKITAAIADEIRRISASGGMERQEIAARFGISTSLVHRIVAGKSWVSPSSQVQAP